MAQRKWELKKEDAVIAYVYISRGLENYKMFEHRDYDFYFEAQREFKKIKDVYLNDDVFLPALKNWIKNYFDDIQLNRLRVKIRTQKSRWKNDRKQMTIDSIVHYRLSQYAKSYNVTLSEAIDRLLDNTSVE